MRLERVEQGQKLGARVKLFAISKLTGVEPPDILRVLLYRPKLFGRPFAEYVNRVLRGASQWSVGERELLGAYISQLNRCAFCFGSHRAMAEKLLGPEIVTAALDEKDSAKLEAPLRAAMTFIKRLVEEPNRVTHADVAQVLAAGVPRDGLTELVHLCNIFCTINPIADALGFRIPSATAFARMAGPLIKHGYKV